VLPLREHAVGHVHAEVSGAARARARA
jgi:hypothetical protein